MEGLDKMKHAYPPNFIETLLDTAERAQLQDHLSKTAMTKLRHIIEIQPSVALNHAMKELVPLLAWKIEEAGGLFFGPNTAA